ncbi:MAG TPA: TIGR03067 domain-containing protein [Gemmataceae bacterium]|nr:TIGR03067 domain-containing protein [Gemmataceae bacterium]
MNKILASTSLFLVGVILLHAGETPSDLDRMQGTWTIVSLVEQTKSIPAAETDTVEYVIKKDVMSVYDKGKLEAQYQVTIDATKTPKAIDFKHLIGENKDRIEPGIFTFDGDKLKLALDEKRQGRPTVFEGKETETYSIVVLKKKADPAKKDEPKAESPKKDEPKAESPKKD